LEIEYKHLFKENILFWAAMTLLTCVISLCRNIKFRDTFCGQSTEHAKACVFAISTAARCITHAALASRIECRMLGALSG